MVAELCFHGFGDGAFFEFVGGLFEFWNHLSPSEFSEASALKSGRASRVGHCEFSELGGLVLGWRFVESLLQFGDLSGSGSVVVHLRVFSLDAVDDVLRLARVVGGVLVDYFALQHLFYQDSVLEFGLGAFLAEGMLVQHLVKTFAAVFFDFLPRLGDFPVGHGIAERTRLCEKSVLHQQFLENTLRYLLPRVLHLIRRNVAVSRQDREDVPFQVSAFELEAFERKNRFLGVGLWRGNGGSDLHRSLLLRSGGFRFLLPGARTVAAFALVAASGRNCDRHDRRTDDCRYVHLVLPLFCLFVLEKRCYRPARLRDSVEMERVENPDRPCSI